MMVLYTIKKLFEAFVFPPGLFVLLAIAASVWMFRAKERKSGWIALTLAAVIWLASMPVVVILLLEKLENGLEVPQDPKGDVIIMLSSGLIEDVDDVTGLGMPADDSMSRLVTTVKLQRKTGLPVIYLIDPFHKENMIEKRFLIDLGVPPDKIITGKYTIDTGTDAKLSRQICESRGFHKPILVTSAIHLKRAVMIFKKNGMNVVPIPAAFKKSKGLDLVFRDFLPTDLTLRDILHEYIGYVYYSLFS